MGVSDEIKKALTASKGKQPLQFLSTGCALYNLAISGRVNGGFLLGGYTFLVGDSGTGKSFTAMTCFAEAANDDRFAKYQLIYDNTENGSYFDIERFFGKKTKERIKAPSYDQGVPVNSTTIESFYYHLDDALDKGPCVYILDSMDGLTSNQDSETFEENKDNYRKGKEAKGSYGMSKAKTNSTHMPHIIAKIEKTKSVLIVVSQTRDNVGFGFAEKTRAGGRALRFYSHVEIWSSSRGRIKRTLAGTDRNLGDWINLKIEKNRVNGWRGEVVVPIYRSIGLDDLGACVEYLVKEGHWKKTKESGSINAVELKKSGTTEALIQAIIKEEKQELLYTICQQHWEKVEQQCKVQRPPRYQ